MRVIAVIGILRRHPKSFIEKSAIITDEYWPRQTLERVKKIAEATQELHLEKCNHYRRKLASAVPNYIQPRPVIVPWSTPYRA